VPSAFIVQQQNIFSTSLASLVSSRSSSAFANTQSLDKKRPPRSSFFLARSSPATPLRCACGGPALRLGGADLTHKTRKRRAAKNPAHPDNALPDKKQNINTAQQHKANIYFCFIAGQSPRRKLSFFCRPSRKPPLARPPTHRSTTGKKTRKINSIA
jgi:hypothetical protein